jgi:hypothetical protein
VLADIGAPAGDDQLADGGAADGAGEPLAPVDEELVLEAPADAVGMAEVVDRGAARVDPGLE